MGYTTDFEGEFKVNKRVDKKTYDLLVGLASTRRMKRKGLPAKYGIDGEFYIEDKEDFGQTHDPAQGEIVDYNTPPSTQPALWCQWEIKEDRKTIQWDGGEKFYEYVEWIEYLIERVLQPKGYVVNGDVKYQGEEIDDRGIIIIRDNKVTVQKLDASGLVECPECGHKFEN